MAKLIELFVVSFNSKKRAINALDFDDLLLQTRNLLRDTPEVLSHCRARYQAILVDEFQDTDEVQAEIIRLLASDPDRPGHFAPGKLMIVGDPKR
jgi:ATP-dependent exoDNAse (exonuclease V) beta subunit